MAWCQDIVIFLIKGMGTPARVKDWGDPVENPGEVSRTPSSEWKPS
jgi:hypothetical protein